MITYDWNISQLDCIPDVQGKIDYVVTAHWQCNGTDGTYSGSVYSTTGFAVEEGEAFTPYNQLTKEQVLGWIWSNPANKVSTEAAVVQQIENQMNPPIVSPALPWSV